METRSFTRFKWFWAWQDQQEEAWLASMAQEGYHLATLVFPTIYRFVTGAPKEMVYRLDYPNLKKQDKASYLQLFRDAGWEFVGDQGGWMYFRRQIQSGEPHEIFTDVESKIAKYQRILAYLVIFLPIWIVVRPEVPAAGSSWFQNLTFVLFMGLIVLWAVAILKLIGRIQSLK